MEARHTTSRINGSMGMWLMCASAAAVCVCGESAFGLDPMGPPAAGLGAGEFKFGADYSQSRMELELRRGEWTEYFDGMLWDWGDAESLTLKKLRMNKVYANLGIGFSDNVEAFVRIGGAGARFGDSIWEDGEEFDKSGEFALGAGIKATLYEDDLLKLGGLIQFSRSVFEGELAAGHWTAADRVDMDISEVQIAFGPTLKVTEWFQIYGGPFFHIVSGNLDDELSEITMGGVVTTVYSWDIKESSAFGAYIGAQVDLGRNCSFHIEYQDTESADAACAGLMWRF